MSFRKSELPFYLLPVMWFFNNVVGRCFRPGERPSSAVLASPRERPRLASVVRCLLRVARPRRSIG